MKRKFVLLLTTLLVVFGYLYLSGESFYAKETRAEVVWKTLGYSATNGLASARASLMREKTFTLEVPMYRQEHRLSCEVAALRMALGRYFIDVSEDELLDLLAFDTREALRGGVWGDPENGFVGDPDGSLSNYTGYGVYEFPIRNLARKYMTAEVLASKDLQAIANLVSSGKPVIVWMAIDEADTLNWQTVGGKSITAHPGEHARVVIGFMGEVSNPQNFILHDPIYGKVIISAERFLKEWNALGSRALVLI